MFANFYCIMSAISAGIVEYTKTVYRNVFAPFHAGK